MTLDQTLERGIDRLSVPQRLTYLAEQARRLNPDELAGVVHAWGASDLFHRRAAAHLAAVARRADLLARFVDDPVVGPPAISASVRAGAAAAVATRLDDLPQVHRNTYYRALRKANLTNVADRLIDQVLERLGDVEAARLVGLCSAEVAARHLPRLVHRVAPGGRSLARLTTRAPDLVAQALKDLVGDLPPMLRLEQLARYASVLEELAITRPTVVFDLVEPALPWWITKATVTRLVRADAPRLAQLLADQPTLSHGRDPLTHAVARELWRAGAAGPLARRLWAPTTGPAAQMHRLHRVLRAVPPGRRTALLEADTPGDGPAQVPLGHDDALNLLPHAARHDVARRRLALVTDHQRRLTLLAHLPVAQVRDELTELTRRPDPDQRTTGYRLLLRAAFAERDDDILVGVLTGLTRLANEQDPVRLAVAQELEIGLRGHLIPEAARPWLDQLVTAASEARDTSYATVDTLLRLVRTSLDQAVLADDRAAVDWALSQIDLLLATKHGVLDVRGLSRTTIDVLLPQLGTWLGRWTISRRLRQVAELHRLRRPQVWDATAARLRRDALTSGSWQATAIQLYLDDPRFRADRAAEVVAAEPSAGYLPSVCTVLAVVRTDVLDPYLVARGVRGQFATSGAFFSPPASAPRRWLPRQQQRYAKALASRMGRPTDRPLTWVDAARLQASCETATTDWLDAYLNSGSVVEIEAALGALPYARPSAAAAPQLLAYADTDRARVALYALGPVLRRLAPSQVTALVRPYLLGEVPAKVTSRKALVHLVDEVALPEAVDLLLASLQTPHQHRDVRFAAVRVLTAAVERPDVAQALATAAASDTIVASALLNTSITQISPTGRVTLGALLVPLLGSPQATVRDTAREQYPEFALWAAGGNSVLSTQLRDPSWTEWSATAAALGRAAALGAVDGLVALVDDLVAWAVTEADHNAPPSLDADLPGYRRLRRLVTLWAVQDRPVAASRRAFDTVVARLSSHETTLTLAAEALVCSAFHADRPHLDGAALAAAADLCRRAPWLTSVVMTPMVEALLHLVNPVVEPLKRPALWQLSVPPRPVELLTVAQTHAAGPAAGMAVALTRSGGETSGWSRDWTDLLARLRAHDDPAVRAAACLVGPRSAIER